MTILHAERFDELVAPWLGDAYTLARYLVGDEHDAQDVVQEAALRALRNLDGYRGGNARAWVLTIVRNCAMDAHRSRRSERNVFPIDEHLPGGDEPDAEVTARSERMRVRAAIAALPVEFREAIVLREIEGLPYKEIGAILGAPVGTVMSRLSRGRARLAELLREPAQEVG